MNRKFPAEWEPQDGILLAWPHKDSDWQPYLDEVELVFVEPQDLYVMVLRG